MTITNGEIVGRLNALQLLSDVVFPVQIAYTIKKNHRKLVSEYKDYEESLNELKTKYPDHEKDPGYMKELQELLDILVVIDFHMLPESLFESGDFTLTATQLEILEFMIETE